MVDGGVSMPSAELGSVVAEMSRMFICVFFFLRGAFSDDGELDEECLECFADFLARESR